MISSSKNQGARWLVFMPFFKVSKTKPSVEVQLGRNAAALLEEEVGAPKSSQKLHLSPSSTPQWSLKGTLGFYKQIPSGIKKKKSLKYFLNFKHATAGRKLIIWNPAWKVFVGACIGGTGNAFSITYLDSCGWEPLKAPRIMLALTRAKWTR